jgi:hypothetical protein
MYIHIEHLPSGKIFITDKIENMTKEEVQNLVTSAARGDISYMRLKIDDKTVFFNEHILKDSVLYMEVIE